MELKFPLKTGKNTDCESWIYKYANWNSFSPIFPLKLDLKIFIVSAITVGIMGKEVPDIYYSDKRRICVEPPACS